MVVIIKIGTCAGVLCRDTPLIETDASYLILFEKDGLQTLLSTNAVIVSSRTTTYDSEIKFHNRYLFVLVKYSPNKIPIFLTLSIRKSRQTF